MKLAVRRLAASLSRPGGPFGEEDRILDVAIALEIFYGGKQGHELAKRAARLLGADATEQIRTYDQARRFYTVRSRIVHAKEPGPAASGSNSSQGMNTGPSRITIASATCAQITCA